MYRYIISPLSVFELSNDTPIFSAQVNKHMPRTLGDGLIHSSNIDCMVEHHAPLPEIEPIIRTPEINEIARLIADNLVEDGATLQTGKYETVNLS